MDKLERFNGGEPIDLLGCPSCGGSVEATHIGNNHSKRRLIRIKCKSCRLQREDAAIRNTWEWLEDTAAEQWNTRTPEQVDTGGECEWRLEAGYDWDDIYDTSCGKAWSFTDEVDWAEVLYCQHCGKPIRLIEKEEGE